MIYGSVCSGIEAASAAWHPLGWKAAFLSEIEAFPRAVLSHHYPEAPLHGDFTTIGADDYGPIDLLVGGTPCQSFSIAGLRGGLADRRGNLALEYLRLADRKKPRWVLWENVPGVLSSGGGRDFGSFLGGLGELGYGFAYRVLDAQYFGLAQRRKRVFVVGHLGDWRRAAAVLFEPASLRGNPAPRREAGERPAPTISSRPTGGGGLGTDFDLDGGLIARCLNAHPNRSDGESETFVPVSFGWQNSSSQGASVSEMHTPTLDKSKTPAVAYAIQERAVSENLQNGPQGKGYQAETAYTLEARNKVQAVAGTLKANNGGGGFGSDPSETFIPAASAVRRLTPRECERLQGFRDDYTLIPYRNAKAADGPRYKALGNSMAVPVMRWIGERIQKQELSLLRNAA